MEKKTGELLSLHTTFRIGGPAKSFISVSDIDELRQALSDAHRPFIIGQGSNILADDGGYDGDVIKLTGSFTRVRAEGDEITAGSGALLSSAAVAAAEASLTGLEFSYGIPGTVGGAVCMNAGAFGGEMKDVVSKVFIYDRETGRELQLSRDDMCFGYRESLVKARTPDEARYIVTGAVMSLERGVRSEIEEKMAEIQDRRRSRQPLQYSSAGSVFKRPEGYFAGKLIEEAGMKGASVGGARVSDMHAGFIINTGEATSRDVKTLIAEVQDRVYGNSGVRLEREIMYL
ncbi:MAG: UDP-N-acetylmuramate dehydrogenase [Lachnospiraceae bacterium]|nr:UDP-N-acetylmuramate dehydrogenase [Lachnospiraceae bacterium]